MNAFTPDQIDPLILPSLPLNERLRGAQCNHAIAAFPTQEPFSFGGG